ncbi:MAG: hypothetical protein GY754_17425 [bacterium]|nr:hypothetical protein [bacterium]
MGIIHNKKILFIGGPILILVSFLNIFIVLTTQPNVKKQEKAVSIACPPQSGKCPQLLNRSIVNSSVELGKNFILNHQRKDGTFNASYNWTNNTTDPGTANQVRQAGSLWGLVLLHGHNPGPRTLKAVKKSIRFFRKNSRESPNGTKWVRYPGESAGAAGTIALTVLALCDFLSSTENHSVNNPRFRESITNDLNLYLSFLLSLRMENGHFYKNYDLRTGAGSGAPSPFFDGESLLALIKASNYLKRNELLPLITESADAMFSRYKSTTGFFQWGALSGFELSRLPIPNASLYAGRVTVLADWIIDEYRLCEQKNNTAIAYKGIIHAYAIAKKNNNRAQMKKYLCYIDRGLFRLNTWQAGSGMENRFLRKHNADNSSSRGGVMSHESDPLLRTDVTQHLAQAFVYAGRFVYPDISTESTRPQ